MARDVWKEFKEFKLRVKVRNKEMLEFFINECKKRNLGNRHPRDISKVVFPICVSYYPYGDRIIFGNDAYKLYDVNDITAEDFMMEVQNMNDKKKANETFVDKKLVVTNDGKVTKARLYDAKDHQNKLICEGTSSCHDDDKFDIYKGAELAIKRCKEKYYESLKPMDKWSRFDKGEISVRVNRASYLEFIGMLKDKGYIWQNGDDLLRWVPGIITGASSIIIESSYELHCSKTICWGEINDYHNSRKDIVDFPTFKAIE